MIERQLRYNVFTSTAEQETLRHKWIFLIINEPREISRIEERILGVLSPCSEKYELGKGSIQKSRGLHYYSFSILSKVGYLDYNDRRKVYDVDKKFKKDRNLRDGIKDQDAWLDNYVMRLR